MRSGNFKRVLEPVVPRKVNVEMGVHGKHVTKLVEFLELVELNRRKCGKDPPLIKEKPETKKRD